MNNADDVNEIEQRVELLSTVLAFPVDEDDYVEKERRVELRRFVLTRIYISLLTPLSGGSMSLSQSLSRSPMNKRSLGSYVTTTMPKP